MRPPTSDSDNFVIHGGGIDFENKQRQLFEHLSQVAREHNKSDSSSSRTELEILGDSGRKTRSPARPFAKQNRSEMRQYRGKESIFKRPEGPAPLSIRKNIADHHKNPHKWVKYSLEDVQTDQMSDRSNTQAAFSFLKELRARKERERCGPADEHNMDTDEPDPDNSLVSVPRCKFTTRIPFRKSADSKDSKGPAVVIVDPNDRPVFRNSKIVLPEYVVGQKKEKVKKTRPIVKIDRSKQLKLSHLEELDE